MELTEQQIKQVENYLEQKKFNFVDLKHEILDHIISDIESLLIKNYSFENSFKITTLKWEKHFKEKSNFILGMLYSESKIVVNKAVKIFKPFYFLYLGAYFLPAIIFRNFSIFSSKNITDFLNDFFYITSIISLIYISYIVINVIKSKIKTTYSFILRTQYIGTIFIIASLLSNNYFSIDASVRNISVSFLFAGFAVTFICHHFYRKHKQAIKKFKVA